LFRETVKGNTTNTSSQSSSNQQSLPSEIQEISNMAARDEEVLIEGTVPGHAIIRVYSVAEVMQILAESNPTFLEELYERAVSETGEILEGDVEIIRAAGLLDRLLDRRRKKALKLDVDEPIGEPPKKDKDDDEDDDMSDRIARLKQQQRQKNASRTRKTRF
jgi:hypothetical protein